MKNSMSLRDKKTISVNMFTTNLGSTIPGRWGLFLLLGLVVLGLAGCKGGGDSGSDSGSSMQDSGSTMQIRPPSGGGSAMGQPDLVIPSITISPSTLRIGERFTLSVTLRNRGNARSPSARLTYRVLGDSRQWLSLDGVNVERLDPSETSSKSYSRGSPGPGTYYYSACVSSVSGESNTSNNCSTAVLLTVSNESNDGGSSSGGGSRGNGPTTATWPCPFGDGGSITVGRSAVGVYDAVIRFRGNTCGNSWVSGRGLGSNYYLDSYGLVSFDNDPNRHNGGSRGITFENFNTSGRTIVRQYTAYFCSKSETRDSAFCGVGLGLKLRTSTFTVRWLSE